MILTDREIQIALSKGLIIIKPEPKRDEAFSSTSVDLRLGEHLIVFRDTKPYLGNNAIDPTHPDYDYATALSEISDRTSIPLGGYNLDPGKLILGWTVEEIDLPITSRVAARVEGKSSLARLGLCVHMTAPTIHAGFQGYIQLEIVNQGPRPITLKTGMRICQLIFETTLGTPSKGYDGQFSGQAAV